MKTYLLAAGIPVLVLCLASGLFSHQDTGSVGGPSVSPVSPMKDARAAHAATLLTDGTVLITGGFAQDREDHPLAEAEIFDPRTNTFRSAGEMTTGRHSHTATVLPDGRVLIVGGYVGRAASTSEMFDPNSGRFERGPDPAVARASHRATALNGGRILISGGEDAAGRILSSVEVYDPASNAFSEVAALTTPRVSHTQTLLADGALLIVGGTSGRRSETRILTSAEVFDPVTNASTEVGEMKWPRYKHAAVGLKDGSVLVIAGSDERDWRGHYDSAEIYNPVTNAFSETGSLNSARFKLQTAAERLSGGRVLVAGGSGTVELFDPETATFHVVAGGLDDSWFFSTATAFDDGRALIAGGYDSRIQSTRRAWVYSP